MVAFYPFGQRSCESASAKSAKYSVESGVITSKDRWRCDPSPLGSIAPEPFGPNFPWAQRETAGCNIPDCKCTLQALAQEGRVGAARIIRSKYVNMQMRPKTVRLIKVLECRTAGCECCRTSQLHFKGCAKVPSLERFISV